VRRWGELARPELRSGGDWLGWSVYAGLIRGAREIVMRFATLISWLLTASLGGYMLRTWIARGGLGRERARAGGLPPQLIFGHAALAVTGLVLWGCFMASGVRALAWAAIVCVMVAVGLGLSTVTLWTPYPAPRPGERRSSASPSAPWDEPGVLVPGTVPDTVAGAMDTRRPRDPEEFQVTDDMIARLLADPRPSRRTWAGGAIRPDVAVLVPVAHGLLAIATFVLAVTTASMALSCAYRQRSLADVCPRCRYCWDGRPKCARRRTRAVWN
jgi:hypothetical protein